MAIGSFERDSVRRLCEKAAGPYFDEMLRSYEATKNHLEHADPRARVGALFLLREYWKPQQEFAKMCETLAFEDDDIEVRSGALSSLCRCYYGTRDVRMAERLARVVRDDGQPLTHRRIAYLGLFSLQGGQDIPQIDKLRIPEGVDWTFVDSFLRRSDAD